MSNKYCWWSPNWHYFLSHRVCQGGVKNWMYLWLLISDHSISDLANQRAFYHNMDKTPRANWLYCVHTLYNILLSDLLRTWKFLYRVWCIHSHILLNVSQQNSLANLLIQSEILRKAYNLSSKIRKRIFDKRIGGLVLYFIQHSGVSNLVSNCWGLFFRIGLLIGPTKNML